WGAGTETRRGGRALTTTSSAWQGTHTRRTRLCPTQRRRTQRGPAAPPVRCDHVSAQSAALAVAAGQTLHAAFHELEPGRALRTRADERLTRIVAEVQLRLCCARC